MIHLQYCAVTTVLFFSVIKMTSSVEHPTSVELLANAQNMFTRDLYQRLSSESNANVFFSPFSIMTAVAMAHVGAKDNTEKQIQTALYFPENKQLLQDGLKQIISTLMSDTKEYQLHIANSAYISDKLSILDSYVNTLVNDFNSKTETVNYNAPEVVRKQINDFVEEITRSKIKDLIPTGVLNPLTRMVLVNAVYFKGLWQHQFDLKMTTNKPFWLNADNKVDVPMMSNKKMFRYGIKPEIESKVLALDYEGNEMRMIIVLPDERDGLAKLEEKLATINFDELDSMLYDTDIRVNIPRFKLENSFELSGVLKKMGVTDLFDSGKADLSGISGGKELFVSNVVHKSFIEVNEEGSEAAAATGVVMMTRMMMTKPQTFIADHPFFFFLKHNPSGQILFAGRLVNPQVSA